MNEVTTPIYDLAINKGVLSFLIVALLINLLLTYYTFFVIPKKYKTNESKTTRPRFKNKK